MNTSCLLVLLSSLYTVGAFTTVQRNIVISPSSSSSSSLQATEQQQRRTFLSKGLSSITFGLGIATTSPPAAWSTLMDKNMSQTKTFKIGENLAPEEAKARFSEARKEVDELIANYSEISKGGGDNVRRYLGTVGVEKKMYGITKVVKGLREEADDIVEYTECANEFEAYLYQAEGAAYQSLFVEHSSSKGTPESFLATAKNDVLSMKKYMDVLAEQLNL